MPCACSGDQEVRRSFLRAGWSARVKEFSSPRILFREWPWAPTSRDRGRENTSRACRPPRHCGSRRSGASVPSRLIDSPCRTRLLASPDTIGGEMEDHLGPFSHQRRGAAASAKWKPRPGTGSMPCRSCVVATTSCSVILVNIVLPRRPSRSSRPFILRPDHAGRTGGSECARPYSCFRSP